MRYLLLLLAACRLVAAAPTARVGVLPDRLTMIVNSLAYHETVIGPGYTVPVDGGDALWMPMDSENLLPAEVTGDAAGEPPGNHRQLAAGEVWHIPSGPVKHDFNEQFAKPDRFGLVFSAYVRGPATVVLGLAWGERIVETEAMVAGEWQRLHVLLPFAEHQVEGSVVASVVGDGPVEVAGLQLEAYGDYPVFQHGPTAWLPGGTARVTRPQTLPAWPIAMDWQQGAVAVKVRIPEPEGPTVSGDRQILLVAQFWQATLGILVDSAHVGKANLRTPALREILADGVEHQLLLTWDTSVVRMYADGTEIAHTAMPPGPVTVVSDARLWIGTHNPRRRNLGGTIRDLWFYDQPIAPADLAAVPAPQPPWMEPPARWVFRRDEENAVVHLALTGDVPADLTASVEGIPGATAAIVRGAAGAAVRIKLQPWQFTVGTLAAAIRLGERRWPWPVEIVPAEARDRYTVGNWGSPGTIADLDWARRIGLGLIDSRNQGPDYLNEVARYGLRASVNYRNLPGAPHPATPAHLAQVERDAARVAASLRPFPWVHSCVHNTEGHGDDDVAASPAAMASLKAELGLDEPLFPPGETWADLAVRPKLDLREFAATGIVPDDYLPLRYMRWLMFEGDGMNLASRRLAAAMHREAPWVEMVQEPASPRPCAYRYADWTDTLTNWRYANTPAPTLTLWREGLAAAAATGKRYYPLTGHCYFSPRIFLGEGDDKVDVPPSGDMAAAFLWTGFALPAAEVRCFGWWRKNWEQQERLRPGGNERIAAAIAEVTRIGPVAGDVPLRPAALAVFLPLTNSLGRASEEWWHAYGGVVYNVVSYFGDHDLQVDFLYEEQVLAGALDPYEYVYIPGLRYQRAAVDAVVQGWRERGGRVILDNLASPAFTADLAAPFIAAERQGMAYRLDEAATAAWVADFRGRLAPYARVEDGAAIVSVKECPGTRFVVAVNNRWRAATLGADLAAIDPGGDIVDEVQEFAEKNMVRQLSTELVDVGVPQTLTLSFRETPTAAIYDLRAGRRLTATPGPDGRLLLRCPVDPGSAVVLAIYPRPATRLVIDPPADARPGRIVELGVRLVDAAGQPLPGRQGVDLTVRDPAGQPFDASAIYRLADGVTRVRLRLPTAAPAGAWRVTASHLASSLSAEATFTVNP